MLELSKTAHASPERVGWQAPAFAQPAGLCLPDSRSPQLCFLMSSDHPLSGEGSVHPAGQRQAAQRCPGTGLRSIFAFSLPYLFLSLCVCVFC